MILENELAAALKAVEKASEICTKVQHFPGEVKSIEKQDKSPVTIADLGSQAAIILEILSAFPGE